MSSESKVPPILTAIHPLRSFPGSSFSICMSVSASLFLTVSLILFFSLSPCLCLSLCLQSLAAFSFSAFLFLYLSSSDSVSLCFCLSPSAPSTIILSPLNSLFPTCVCVCVCVSVCVCVCVCLGINLERRGQPGWATGLKNWDITGAIAGRTRASTFLESAPRNGPGKEFDGDWVLHYLHSFGSWGWR